MGPSNKVYVYFKTNIVRDIISKTVSIIRIIQNQQYVTNFSDKNIWKHYDFMNKCNMNEYDSFKNVFEASLTNNEKWAMEKFFVAFNSTQLNSTQLKGVYFQKYTVSINCNMGLKPTLVYLSHYYWVQEVQSCYLCA